MSTSDVRYQIHALHGFTGCGEDFLYLESSTPPDYHWHSPNLPGHGPSPQIDCSPEATVNFVEATLRSIRSPTSDLSPPSSDLRPPTSVLLGYSMGARAALLHATTYPKAHDALILISGNPGIESENKRQARRASDEALAKQIDRDGAPAFLEYWKETPMIRSQQNIRADWRERMQANRAQHTAAGLAQSLRQFGQGSCPNLWPQLSELTMPILLITGEGDSKFTAIAQRFAQAVPNATHVIIPKAGHMPQLEASEATIVAIQAFLSETKKS